MDGSVCFGGEGEARDTLDLLCSQARSVIGESRIVSPREVSEEMGIVFCPRRIEHLEKTFPTREIRDMRLDEDTFLLSIPPVCLDDLYMGDLCANNPRGIKQPVHFNHTSAMSWRKEKWVRDEQAVTGWMIFHARPVFGKEARIFSGTKIRPNVTETVWAVLALRRIIGISPFNGLCLKTFTTWEDKKNGKKYEAFVSCTSACGISVGMIDVDMIDSRTANMAEVFIQLF